jgi:hypothetical protein
LRFTATLRGEVPWADNIEREPGVTVSDAVHQLARSIPGCFASTADIDLAHALIAVGSEVVRHAHQMRLPLPTLDYHRADFIPFNADATPPVPWPEALPGFVAAYPPSHPDHLPDEPGLIESYLVPYTSGGLLGPLICPASAIAVRDGYAYGGILVVDRPDEGPWVCDIWRDPDPAYAGMGAELLRWSAARLSGHTSLGLVVTARNERALRTYERVGFALQSTAWTVRLPT